MAEELLAFTDANFDAQVLASELPVLVDFWATWCEPCKRIEPVIKELAAHYAGKMIVGKLNIEECPVTARRYAVRNMPTFMIFKKGELAGTQMGAVAKSQMMQFIDRAI